MKWHSFRLIAILLSLERKIRKVNNHLEKFPGAAEPPETEATRRPIPVVDVEGAPEVPPRTQLLPPPLLSSTSSRSSYKEPICLKDVRRNKIFKQTHKSRRPFGREEVS